ncbi:glycosyltransferase 87 family protein [Pseudoxanthomonas suwonensis]|uniref:glycosyltransferase 87 family protein n=1 Tax=Pseudoxanthomonas suwonensis TaxID=314722 RepID=UPI00048A698A|nr:glycosyltransferase 87 family protein [Pseudoxanthomonas suwonensis]
MSLPGDARWRALQAAAARVFGFGSRAGVVGAAAAVALLVAAVSLLRGQDANWDLRNYHVHNGWAWLQGRLGMDLAPAQLQTYFVPLLDVPYFLLVQHAPAPVAGALLGLVHGLAFLPVAWIAWRALAGDPRRDWLAPLLGLAGLASAAFLSELGTTMGDNTTAPLVLGALALCLPVAGVWRNGRTVLAGVLLGAAVALKLTNAIYAVALGLAVLAAPLPWPARLRTGVLLAGVALLVFAVLAGPWLHAVWQVYGNPLFPQYNVWFQAPLASPGATADLRWRPQGLGEALLRPLLFTLNPRLVSELSLLQVAWALLYVVAPLAALAWLRRRTRGGARPEAADASVLRMLGVFFVVGFVLWLWMFSIHRYLVVLELLAPLVLWLLLRGLLPGRAGSSVAGAAVLLCALVALAGWNDWGHARWTREAFRVEAPAGPPPGLVLMGGDEPQSWRIPFLPDGPVYVGVGTNFPEAAAYVEQVRALVAAHPDSRVMLPAEADASGGGKLLERLERNERHNRWAARLGLDRGDCLAMRWIAGRSSSRGLVEPADSPSGRCRFVAVERGQARPLDGQAMQDAREQLDRERIAAAAAMLEQRYGLRLHADACTVHRSWIGASAFPYRLCRVGLLDAGG